MFKAIIKRSLIKNSKDINPIYLCSYCNDIFDQVYQIECSCRSCVDCVTSRLNLTICSNCNQTIDPNNTYKDKAFQKEVDNLIVICNQCAWTGKLREFFEHLKQQHPNQSENMPNSEVANSIQNVYKNLNDRIVCLEKAVSEKKSSISELKVDENDDRMSVDGSDDFNSTNENILNNLNQLKQKEISFTKQINQNIETTKKLSNGINSLVTSHEYLSKELAPTKQTITFLQASLVSIDDRLTLREKSLFHGVLNWRIEDIEEKLSNVNLAKDSSFYSPPFYTNQYGYKLCGKITFNITKNQVSLFIVVMKGEYDPLLKWPFNQKVTFILIDQPPSLTESVEFSKSQNAENLVKTLKPNPVGDSFKRPTTEMNTPEGEIAFCTITQLKSSDHRYIKDNCMFVKIVIDCRGIQT